jgi:hypothetical protein
VKVSVSPVAGRKTICFAPAAEQAAKVIAKTVAITDAKILFFNVFPNFS